MIEESMTLDRVRVQCPYVKNPSVLSDNRAQVIRLTTHLERRMKNDDHIHAYNKEIQGCLDRDFIREVSQKEINSWTGPVNYISHHGVTTPGSRTTPLRAVSNSSLDNNGSGHLYNSLLAKGPNDLPPLLEILVPPAPTQM